MTDLTATNLAPPIDPRTAQIVATVLVGDALATYTGSVEFGGEHYEVTRPVRADQRPGLLDGIVTFHISDGTRDRAVAVTLTVAVTPLGGA